jgi:ABC-2 type transport system permease protein
MSPAITLATTRRILQQLRHDPRTMAMMILLPGLLVVLLRYVLNAPQAFEQVAPSLLAIFPFNVMFLITSVATLRERSTGTLERLMTMPINKLDLLMGYALAFGFFAILEVTVVAALSILWLGLSVAGSVSLLIMIAVLDALLGMALGLFVSAFARTEFQAVQFMPLFSFPQVLLCGLFTPREQMAPVLTALSDLLPLSYAVDGIRLVTASGVTDVLVRQDLIRDVAVVASSAVLALVLGAATLSRQSP